MRVLVVEDDLETADYITSSLKAQGGCSWKFLTLVESLDVIHECHLPPENSCRFLRFALF